jgi:hypothetical protein
MSEGAPEYCPNCQEKRELKTQLRSHIDLLQTLLEKFDERADGTSDATPLEKFCNEMIGLYNSISLKETRTLIQDRDQWKQSAGELAKEVQFLLGEIQAVKNTGEDGVYTATSIMMELFRRFPDGYSEALDHFNQLSK